MNAPRLAVFGYASLVSPESASETLSRPIADGTPARLDGWRRRWSAARDNLASEKTFARREDESLPSRILGLNVEPSATADEAPNGLLLEVSEPELRRLDMREMRYDRVEVTGAIRVPNGATAGFDRVFTYRVKPAHFAPVCPPGAVVIGAYTARVEAAFAALGDEQLRLYRATTGPPPVEVIDAVLVRDRIRPGNPREW